MFDRDVFVVCLGDTAALEGLGQRDRQPVADCRDQVSGMTLRWNDAAAGGWDDWVFELFRRGGDGGNRSSFAVAEIISDNLQRIKSVGSAQRFLSTHAAARDTLNVQRPGPSHCQQERAWAFEPPPRTSATRLPL